MLWVITRPWFWSLIKDYIDFLWSESQRWSQHDAEVYSSTNWTELNLKRPVSLLFWPGCSLTPPLSQNTPQWRAGTNPIPALAPPWNPQDPEDTPPSVWHRRTFRGPVCKPRRVGAASCGRSSGTERRGVQVLCSWSHSCTSKNSASNVVADQCGWWKTSLLLLPYCPRSLFYFQLLRIRHSSHNFFKIKGPARA